jgi:hypothetical protein
MPFVVLCGTYTGPVGNVLPCFRALAGPGRALPGPGLLRTGLLRTGLLRTGLLRTGLRADRSPFRASAFR